MRINTLQRILSISAIISSSIYISPAYADDLKDNGKKSVLAIGGALAGLGLVGVTGAVATNKLKKKSPKLRKKVDPSVAQSSKVNSPPRPFADSTPPWQESRDISAYTHEPSTPWDHSPLASSSPMSELHESQHAKASSKAHVQTNHPEHRHENRNAVPHVRE